MSVARRKGSPYYWAEFTIDGVRFRRSTGETDKRLALAVEKRLKQELKAEIETRRAEYAKYGGKPAPTLGYCVARYWTEVGQFHAASKTTWNALEWLADYFGPDTLLTDITTEKIAVMVAHRRGIRIKRDPKTNRLISIPCEQVTNATVNRYATEPLRKLFRRARDVWEYKVTYPRWGELLLPEPKEREREASYDEEAKIVEALGPDYGRLFRFILATGLRARAALLTWPQVDFINATIRVRNKSLNGQERWHTVPLTSAAMAILMEAKGHHPTHVFTYTALREKGPNHRRGARYPITDNGFKTAWRRAVREAGIAPGFRRHDIRHTTGTRYLRATGNLRATQKLLGHSRIETTLRYAHVLVDDVRQGMETMERSAHNAANPHKIPHNPDAKANSKG